MRHTHSVKLTVTVFLRREWSSIALFVVKFKAEGRIGGLKVFWCLAMRWHLKLKRTKFHLNKNFLYHLNKTVNKRGILFPFLSKYFILYVKCKLFLVFQEFKFENRTKGSKENNHFNIFLIFLGKLNPIMIVTIIVLHYYLLQIWMDSGGLRLGNLDSSLLEIFQCFTSEIA